MAKKARTPTPPRRPVQGPTPAAPPPLWRRPLVLALAGLLVVGAIVLAVVLTGGGGSGASAIEGSRVCTAKTLPDLGARHINDLNAKIKYNSTPPTSGPHYYAWAIWGRYPNPVPEVMAVHNLEHGGLVVQYGSKVPTGVVDEVGAFYDKDPNGILMFPRPSLGDTIALTTWTQLMTCTGYDAAAFTAFRDTYRYKAPEQFPKEELEPGQGPG